MPERHLAKYPPFGPTSLVALALMLGAAAGCRSESGAGAGDEPGVGSGDGPLYVTTLQLPSPGEDVGPTYLVTADSVEAGSEWSTRSGVEMPGWTFPFGFDRYPSIWLNDGNGTVDRWDLQADGSLRPPTLETTFSTAGLGVVSNNFIWWGALLSPELAVGPNASVAGTELVRWNPTTMEILGTLPLELPEQAQTWGRVRARPDGTLLVGYSCSTYDENEVLEQACTGVLILNPEATEIVGRDERQGCAAWLANQGWSTRDGTEYFADGWTVQTDEWSPANACWLRVLPGATEFDPDFDSSQLFEGSQYVIGGFYPLGERAVFRYYPESLNPERDAGVIEAFQWATWDYESEQPEPLPGPNEWFGSGVDPIRVDGRLFFQDQAGWDAYWACEDTSCQERERALLDKTPFYELTESGVEPAFTLTGGAQLTTIVRVR